MANARSFTPETTDLKHVPDTAAPGRLVAYATRADRWASRGSRNFCRRGRWWFFLHPYVTTDDARVAATLVRVAREGVSGRVVRVAVQEGDHVKKGDVLIELDHRATDAQEKRARARALGQLRAGTPRINLITF